MADDRTDKHPNDELDPGSPHMDPEDYRHMGISGQSEPAGEPNDALASKVLEHLTANERLRHALIHVEIRGDTTILTGTVPDRHARGRAEELAREIEGVASVLNRLVVQHSDSGGPILTTSDPNLPDEPSTRRS